MKKELLNDCACALNEAQELLAKIAEIETIREKFKGGEPLKLSVTCGDTEVCDRLLLANGKAIFMHEVLDTFAMQAEMGLKIAISTLEEQLTAGSSK